MARVRMTSMHIFLVVLAELAVVVWLAAGVAAVTRGWIVPFVRKRVQRPKLWGYGALAGGTGAGLFVLLVDQHGAAGNVALYGWGLMTAGVITMFKSQRPSPTP
jgi:hypothetical protein